MKRIVSVTLVILLIFAGCSFKKKEQQPPPNPNQVVQKNITLYFSDNNLNLIQEKRQITLNSTEQVEKRILQELIKGPATQELKSTVPQETKVNSVTIQNGTAVVDLSEEFVSKHWGGSEAENLTIYSVVNTLTELINISKVEFLIDGQPRQVFNHMELEGAFGRDETIIK